MTSLPDCMMPDGAHPCRGYAELLAERDWLRAAMVRQDRAAIALANATRSQIERLQAERRMLIDALGPLLEECGSEAIGGTSEWWRDFWWSDVIATARTAFEACGGKL